MRSFLQQQPATRISPSHRHAGRRATSAGVCCVLSLLSAVALAAGGKAGGGISGRVRKAADTQGATAAPDKSGAGGLSPGALAPPAEKTAADKIAVMPLEIGGAVPAGRPALEEAVRRGLSVVTTASVIVGPEVAASLSAAGVRVACVEPVCYQAVGRTLGARHLVTGNVDRKGADFVVEFKLIAASDGRVLDRQINRCEASECSVAELSRLTVLEMARAGLNGDVRGSVGPEKAANLAGPGAGVLPPPNPAVAADSASPGPSGGAIPSVDLTKSQAAADEGSAPSWRTWVPPVAIAGGVVAGAVGGYLFSLDGKEKGCHMGSDGIRQCEAWHVTRWWGIGVGASGVALFATGLVLALNRPDATASDERPRAVADLQIGVTPSGVLLGGRF